MKHHETKCTCKCKNLDAKGKILLEFDRCKHTLLMGNTLDVNIRTTYTYQQVETTSYLRIAITIKINITARKTSIFDNIKIFDSSQLPNSSIAFIFMIFCLQLIFMRTKCIIYRIMVYGHLFVFNKTMFEASIEKMIYTFVFVFEIKHILAKKYNYNARIIFTNYAFNFNFIIWKIKILSPLAIYNNIICRYIYLIYILLCDCMSHSLGVLVCT